MNFFVFKMWITFPRYFTLSKDFAMNIFHLWIVFFVFASRIIPIVICSQLLNEFS